MSRTCATCAHCRRTTNELDYKCVKFRRWLTDMGTHYVMNLPHNSIRVEDCPAHEEAER